MDTRALSTWEVRRPRLPLPLSRLGDEALARLVERGEERVFAALFDRYHQTLYRYSRSIVRSDADAEDVVQAVFASAFVALRDRRRDAPLKPWLFRIAHNESISVLRRRRPDAELTDGIVADTLPVEDTALQRERLARLVDDVLQLPERQRAALVMRELNGLSHEEIAVALECSAGAAKQTIFEARRALAELEEGRVMSCDEICRKISDGDRRALRGRKVRAHLAACAPCAAFADAIPARTADLRALAPALPSGGAAMLLARTLRGAAGSGDTGRLTAAAAGKAAAGVTSAKLTAGAVLFATATVGLAHLGAQHPSAPRRVVTATAVTSAATRTSPGAHSAVGPATPPAPVPDARPLRTFPPRELRAHQGRATATMVAKGAGASGGAAISASRVPAARRAANANSGGSAGAGRGLAVGRAGAVPPGVGLHRAAAGSTAKGTAAGGVRSPAQGRSHRSASGSAPAASASARAASGSARAASDSARAASTSPYAAQGAQAGGGSAGGQAGAGNPHVGT
jgi:RNA polymerase sigma factor (sigma-70 family)